MARYITKEKVKDYEKRWTTSRNLIQSRVHVKKINSANPKKAPTSQEVVMIMEQEKKKLNCDKCLCRMCFSKEEGTCINCVRCKENGGVNKVLCGIIASQIFINTSLGHYEIEYPKLFLENGRILLFHVEI